MAGGWEEAHLGYGSARMLFPGVDIVLGYVVFELVGVASIEILALHCNTRIEN